MMKKLISLLVFLFLSATDGFLAVAQVRLVRHNRPVSRILVTSSEPSDSTAAALLQDFVKRSTSACLPIFKEEEAGRVRKGDVLIGNEGCNRELVRPDLPEDGYFITTEDECLRILSGGDGNYFIR